jgi:hypothetical protein
MRPFTVAACAALPLAAACSAPLATPGSSSSTDAFLRDAAEGASTAALVAFERTTTANETVHGSAVGRFVRMRSGLVDDATLRMVGATLDLPALGSCSRTGPDAQGLSADTEGSASLQADGPHSVELLDVGDLTVEAGGVRASLEARALPDIVDLVTGVLYSTRTAFAADGLPTRGAYVLRSSGSGAVSDGEHGVPAFAVSTTAPGEPEELLIEGQDARSADGVELALGGPVSLRWKTTDGGDDDVVYVDVVAATADEAAREAGDAAGNVRCAFADRGSAVLPSSVFAIAAADGTRGELARGTLVVHRVHREAFQVAGQGRTGIEAGVVRFDFARAAEFARR